MRIRRRFGAEAAEIAALAEGRPELLEPVAEGLDLLGVELLAAVQREGALTVDDVLDRRTRTGLVPGRRALAEAAAEQAVAAVVPSATIA
jgi:glycerol-3-phosphate dehydrogenase